MLYPGMRVSSLHPGISLDVDADRDGVVEKNSPNKVTQPLALHGKSMGLQSLSSLRPSGVFQASWTWGPEGHGAILLVSCDKDNPFTVASDCDDERVFSREGKYKHCIYIYIYI